MSSWLSRFAGALRRQGLVPEGVSEWCRRIRAVLSIGMQPTGNNRVVCFKLRLPAPGRSCRREPDLPVTAVCRAADFQEQTKGRFTGRWIVEGGFPRTDLPRRIPRGEFTKDGLPRRIPEWRIPRTERREWGCLMDSAGRSARASFFRSEAAELPARYRVEMSSKNSLSEMP